jgi:ABC-2 type transport system ATP-binding protein
MTGVIETEDLSKRYGEARGIEGVSMSVEAGEVFGFLGPNGAGKTTTIRTLLDLLHPTSGSARLFGLDSRRESLAIRARLGNLPCGTWAGPCSSPSASTPISNGRWASSRAAAARRSA